MHQESRSLSSLIEEFMAQTIYRCELTGGTEIITDASDNSVQDLLDEVSSKAAPLLNLDISWVNQVPPEQALLLFLALHHCQEQIESGSLVGASLLSEFPQEWLIELAMSLVSRKERLRESDSRD